MTIAELIEAGERLVKPSLLLSPDPNGAAPVGHWGGEHADGYKGRPDDRHKLSFDCDWLKRAGIDVWGAVGLYDVNRKWKWPKPIHVDYRATRRFDSSQHRGGRPLYGVERVSFPPLQAVCLYGDEPVTDWLTTEGLARTDYDSAGASDLGSQYEQEWVARCPLYEKGWAAVLGGWHLQWPEDDFYMPAEMQLVCWTFWESEPWIELWRRASNFRVEMRVT